MNPQDNDGERIIARMSAIRAASHHHVEELHHEANRLVDWREYVRARPALAIAAAAGVGFILTVGWKRTRSTQQVIIERPVAKVSKRPAGLRAGAMSLFGSLAGSLIRQYAMRQLQSLMSQPPASSSTPEREPPSPPVHRPASKRY